MKKIAAFLLALVLCLGSLPAFAVVDLGEFTQEDLIALRESINQELLRRGIEKEVTVPVGVYVVGVDIPAGTYSIKPEVYGWIRLYKNASASFSMFSEGIEKRKNEYIGKLVLTDGNIVEITSGSLIFAPYQGLGF